MRVPTYPLPSLALASLLPALPPAQCIFTEEDVELWRQSEGWRRYGSFVRSCAEAVEGVRSDVVIEESSVSTIYLPRGEL